MILAAKGIVPDDDRSYTVNDIKTAISSRLGVSPILICYKEKNRGVQYINEVQICLNKTLHLMDCPKSLTHHQYRCSNGLQISYPKIKPEKNSFLEMTLFCFFLFFLLMLGGNLIKKKIKRLKNCIVTQK
jgi:hypothetical protein